MKETPKNTFRDEVQKQTVSERAMLRRDQKVTYLRFKCQAEMAEADRLHTQRAIGKCKAFGNEIFQLPDSEARTAILAENKAHVEALEKQLAAQKPTLAQRVLLSILEEKFGEETKPTLVVEPPTEEPGAGDVSEELKDE